MTQEEQKYTFRQSMQIEMQTTQVGYLRGYFGKDGEFCAEWFDTNKARKTDSFMSEFNEVITALRSDEYGLLASRPKMQEYVKEHGSAFDSAHLPTYGIRAETGKYAYLIRCCPSLGDYNFYCYCYEKQWLDHHIQKAKQGIRFKDADYKEIFRIPDGASIVITTDRGEKMERACRYIDETHCKVGNNLFHIDDFAERMERNGSTYAPKDDVLPKAKQQTR